MNLERTKPETLAAAALDLTPSHFTAAHDYAERLNAALARLGLTDRLTLPSAPATAIDELPAVVDVPLRKTLQVLMGKAQQGDASALATLEWTAQVAESIFAGLHARASVYPLALPSHESLATLSQGVDALRERKIGGLPEAPDGISIGNLIASPFVEQITEIDDSANKYNPTFNYNVFLSLFPNLRKFVLGAEIIDNYWCKVAGDLSLLEEFEAPHLRVFSGVHGGTWAEMFLLKNCNTGNLTFPSLEEVHTSATSGFFIINNTTMEEFHAPLLRDVRSCADNWEYKYLAYTSRFLVNCTALKKVVTDIQYVGNIHANASQFPFAGSPNIEFIKLGQLKSWNNGFLRTSSTESMPNLVHLEIGEGTAISLDFQYWNPTSVLSDSERLPIFLSNFKTYIAERLSEQGSGLTLTLSQAVRDAIEGDPTIAQIITSKGWTISPAPTA